MGKFMAKIPNFDLFGLYSHVSAPINMIFGMGEQCQISHLLGQCVAPVGRKPFFGPLSKRNTSMAVLHAGLLVIETNRNVKPECTHSLWMSFVWTTE